MPGYSMESDPETTARAIGRDLPISPRHTEMICKQIRGWKLEKAKDYLAEVVELKSAVPDTRYKGCSHRKGKLGPGRFPKKAAGYVLRLLEGAEANAEYKGLSIEGMVIMHISANPGRTYESYFRRARGRSTPKRRETVNVEVILRETKEKEE